MTEIATIEQPADQATPSLIPDTLGRPLPWQGITTGTAVDDDETLTSGELIERADLNWTVAKRPLWRRLESGEMIQSGMSHEIYRTDTEEQLGAVKGAYEPYQNAAAFEFGDSLVADGRGRWIDAGLQGNGWRVFMAMMLTEPFEVLGGDRYSLYLFLQTSHDGSSAIKGYVTPIRFFCTNQAEAIRNSALSRFSFQHTGDIAARMAEAQKSFEIAVNYEAQFTQLAEDLAAIPMTGERFAQAMREVIPEREGARDKKLAQLQITYETSPTVEPYRDNAYGALQAVTEYLDHVKTFRTGNARFEQIMHGAGARTRNAATERLLAFA